MQQVTFSGDSHLTHVAPSVLPSLENIKAVVMGNMWVILHPSAMTKTLLLSGDRTWELLHSQLSIPAP